MGPLLSKAKDDSTEQKRSLESVRDRLSDRENYAWEHPRELVKMTKDKPVHRFWGGGIPE